MKKLILLIFSLIAIGAMAQTTKKYEWVKVDPLPYDSTWDGNYKVPTLDALWDYLSQLNDSALSVQYIDFDTTVTVLGQTARLKWNDTDGTLDLGMPGFVTMQLGQESFVKVINKTADTIFNGKAVFFSGRQGNRPKIELAQSDSTRTSRVIGLTTQDIPPDSMGYVTTTGYVRQIKTNYSGWAEGDYLYVSAVSEGELTDVEPAIPHHSDIVGTVGIVGGAGIGSILIDIQRHQDLTGLADVDGTPLTRTGQVPVWDNDSMFFDFSWNTDSIEYLWDKFVGAGRIYGGEIMDNSDGSVKVAAGKGMVKTSGGAIEQIPVNEFSDPISKNLYVAWDTVDVTLTDEAYNYIYFRGSDSTMQATTNFYAIDFYTDFTVGRVYRSGNDCTIRLCGTNLWNFNRRVQLFGEEYLPVVRAKGLMMAEVPDLGLSITEGVVWAELVNRFTIEAFTTATDSIKFWWRDAPSGWLYDYDTIFSNSLFDDGDGTLGTVNITRYGIFFVYVVHDGSVHAVYGQSGTYTLAQAREAQPPGAIPGIVGAYGTLIGKVIVLRNSATITEIQSAFTVNFSGSAVADHGDLAGLLDDDHTQYALLAGRSNQTFADSILGQLHAYNSSTWQNSKRLAVENDIRDKIETMLPGGSNTEFQYNNAGVLGGATDITYSATYPQFVMSGASTKGLLIENNAGNGGLDLWSDTREAIGYKTELAFVGSGGGDDPLTIYNVGDTISFKNSTRFNADKYLSFGSADATKLTHFGTGGSSGYFVIGNSAGDKNGILYKPADGSVRLGFGGTTELTTKAGNVTIENTLSVTDSITQPIRAYNAGTWQNSSRPAGEDAIRDKIESLALMTYPGAGVALSTGSAWGTSITTSAGLAGALSDETGTGALMFGTVPTVTDSILGPLHTYNTATWNNSKRYAIENDVRDKIESLVSGGGEVDTTGTPKIGYIPKFFTAKSIGSSPFYVTGTDTTLLSTYKGANADGLNLWMGGGGVTSVGEGGATHKGSRNAVFGIGASAAITTGYNVTSIGAGANAAGTYALHNTAVGAGALAANVSSHYNTAIGSGALPATTTTGYNTGVGYSAFVNMTSGSNNVGVGNIAGSYIATAAAATTVNNSVFVGYDTRPNGNSQTNQIAIGYATIGNGSNTATWGNTSITQHYFSGNLNTATVKITGGSPGSGKVLTSDADGDATWATVTAGTPTAITVAQETADVTGYPLFVTAPTGDLGPKTNNGLRFDATTSQLQAVFMSTETAFVPDADNGAALGTTALRFSSLHLAEGSAINWDNGDATITQSGNAVTLAGADFNVIDEAYGSGWNGSLEVPTKNAVYDKIQAMTSGTETIYNVVKEYTMDSIRYLNTNPLTLIPDPGANLAIDVISCSIRWVKTEAWTCAGNTPFVTGNASGGQWYFESRWASTSAISDKGKIAASGTSGTVFPNKPIFLYVQIANPTADDGTYGSGVFCRVYLAYRIIPQ